MKSANFVFNVSNRCLVNRKKRLQQVSHKKNISGKGQIRLKTNPNLQVVLVAQIL